MLERHLTEYYRGDYLQTKVSKKIKRGRTSAEQRKSTEAKNYMRVRKTKKVQRSSCGKYWACSSQFIFAVSLVDFRGRKPCWGVLQIPKFKPFWLQSWN